MSANVERVLAEIRALPPEEQRQVQERLTEILTQPQPAMTEEEFEQHLVEEGVLSAVRPRLTEEDIARFRSYKPIQVEGKPVSETLIEERR